MNNILIVAAFAIIGAGLKYVDDAFDEETFSKKIATAVTPIILFIWICLSVSDPTSATILSSVLFAVLLSRKTDNSIFLLSSAVLVILTILAFDIQWLPLILLTLFGFIDEKGNDYADRSISTKWTKFILEHRFCMKIAVFVLCLLSVFNWLYAIAFLMFDISYEAVNYCGNAKRRKRKEANKHGRNRKIWFKGRTQTKSKRTQTQRFKTRRSF